MASRGQRVEDGLGDARTIIRTLADDIRDARLAAGISQGAAARAAGVSASQWGRLERGDLERPDVVQLSCAGRALGMRASLKFYPVGSPVRDRPQLALFGRFGGVLGAPLRPHAEVTLPISEDLRAWDVMVDGDGAPFFADLETHATDAQALERRLRLKQRDDPRATVVLLVLSRSVHHRRFLAEYREVFRDLLPLDAPVILRSLRAGRRPPASGIVML